MDAALDDISLLFRPEITSYTITLTKPQEITVSVSAPGMRINDMRHAEALDRMQHTYTVDADTRLSFRLQTDAGTTTYTIIFRVAALPADESDPPPESSGSQTDIPPAGTDPQPDDETNVTQQPEQQPGQRPEPSENQPPQETQPDIPWQEEETVVDEEPEMGIEADTRLHIQMNIGLDILFCNDTAYLLDTAPFLAIGLDGNGHTMVPVRFVAEALGATVGWNAAQQQVTIELGEVRHLLTIGEPAAGTAIAACIHDDRTFVPLRYIMESFGAEVAWTAREQRIDIWYETEAR